MSRAPQNDSGRVQTRGIIGSLWYMSPEQVTGRRDLDLRVDIYALGILLYQLVCGRTPFQGSAQELLTQHLEAALPPPPPGKVKVSMALAGLMLRLTAKSPGSRVPDARNAVDALQALLERTPDEPLAAPMAKKPSGEAQKKLLQEALADPLEASIARESGAAIGPAEFDPTKNLVSDDED